jgi:hypothetical protein
LEGQADSDMNCTVGNGSPSPEEATAGSWGPWAGIAVDALDPEHSGTSLPTESKAEALATRRQVERQVELSVLHGQPWGFFGPPVPLAMENRTRSRGRGKLKGTGVGPLWLPMFPRVLRVTGF